MTSKSIKAAIRRAIKTGNWMIRTDIEGESYKGFRWSPLGEWTEAPDWTPAPACGGGLHGQGPEASGFGQRGTRLLFCETSGERVNLGNKIKVKRARILMVDELPAGLRFSGSLNLSWCRNLTALPDNLSVGGWLDLGCCRSLTALGSGLTVDGSLDLTECHSLTALPDNLSVGNSLDLYGCDSLTTLGDGLSVGGWLHLNYCRPELIAEARARGYKVVA